MRIEKLKFVFDLDFLKSKGIHIIDFDSWDGFDEDFNTTPELQVDTCPELEGCTVDIFLVRSMNRIEYVFDDFEPFYTIEHPDVTDFFLLFDDVELGFKKTEDMNLWKIHEDGKEWVLKEPFGTLFLTCPYN